MAFGGHKGTLTASVASVTNPTNATGSVAVVVGDLIFVNFAQQTGLTAASVTDNLHGATTYTAVNAGTDAGTATIRCFFHRVTVAGTLTTVAVAATASANDASCVVSVIEGPFAAAPLDANPANTTDGTTPFDCPPTGTRTQAIEVVMAAIAVNSAQTVAATAPATLAGTVNRANISSGNSVTVFTNNTATVTPQFTGTTATAAQTTASFDHDSAFTVGVPIVLPASAPTQRALYYQARVAPIVVPAAAVVEAPYGWWPQISQPVQRGASLALIAAGLVLVPTPPQAAPRGWEAQESVAPKRPDVQLGSSFVPFDTLQNNTTTIDKWQQPLSKSIPKPPRLGYSVVPFDTRQANTETIDKWQQPLSIAVPAPPVWQGHSSVPFDTTQFVEVPSSGWLTGLSVAPKRPPMVQSELRPFAVQEAEEDNSGTVDTWLRPLSKAAPIPHYQIGWSFVPLDTFQPNTQTIDKWQQPLSKAVPIPRYQVGWTFVPFNTAQPEPGATPQGWWQPLSKAVPRRPVWQGGAVWIGRPLAGNNVDLGGWQQPLSRAVPHPPVRQGSSSVPFDTAQFVAAPSIAWLADLSRPANRPAFIPPDLRPFAVQEAEASNTGTVDTWLLPLSRAVRVPHYANGATFVPLNTFQPNTINYSLYQQPLSRAASIPSYAVGWTFVPLDTVQVIPPAPTPTDFTFPFVANVGSLMNR